MTTAENRRHRNDGSSGSAGADPLEDEQARIERILATSRTVAVVGLSNSRWRPAYGVAAYLKAAGYTIIPVGPDDEVLGEPGYRHLGDVPVPIDMVDIFRRPEAIPGHVQEAIDVGARAVWLQLGLRSPEAERRAREAGLDVVADRCTKIEHARLAAHGDRLPRTA